MRMIDRDARLCRRTLTVDNTGHRDGIVKVATNVQIWVVKTPSKGLDPHIPDLPCRLVLGFKIFDHTREDICEP